MAKTVIGIFETSNEAQTAVQQLTGMGISRDRIDISDRSNATTTTDRYDDDDDSISGFFRSLFGSDDDSRKYSTVARHGCVVTVHAQSDEEAHRAAELLDDYGAVDVDKQAARFGYTGATGTTAAGYTGTATTDTTRTTTDTDYNRTNFNSDRLDTDRAIPIIEENLQVGKREVETGGVRLRSRIIERPVEEHLRLREEHVNVERNPVNRPATEADLNTFREGTIELTERAEVPVVNKEARVVEEVSLNKNVEEREEVVRDTVRKTEVDVENLDRTNVRNDLDNRLDNRNNIINDTDDRSRLDLDNDRRRADLDGDRSTAL